MRGLYRLTADTIEVNYGKTQKGCNIPTSRPLSKAKKCNLQNTPTSKVPKNVATYVSMPTSKTRKKSSSLLTRNLSHIAKIFTKFTSFVKNAFW